MGDRRENQRVRIRPNRVAALGENVILLINLARSRCFVRFLTGRGCYSALEQWQTGYMPVYAGVGGHVVVILFPPLFSYV
ncbi:MAG: hypothetical protein U1G07_17305 [Verrucomicrobiota bacterium]